MSVTNKTETLKAVKLQLPAGMTLTPVLGGAYYELAVPRDRLGDLALWLHQSRLMVDEAAKEEAETQARAASLALATEEAQKRAELARLQAAIPKGEAFKEIQLAAERMQAGLPPAADENVPENT